MSKIYVLSEFWGFNEGVIDVYESEEDAKLDLLIYAAGSSEYNYAVSEHDILTEPRWPRKVPVQAP